MARDLTEIRTRALELAVEHGISDTIDVLQTAKDFANFLLNEEPESDFLETIGSSPNLEKYREARAEREKLALQRDREILKKTISKKRSPARRRS